MSELVDGTKLLIGLNIRDFELFDYVKKGSLQPHDSIGRPLPPPNVQAIQSALEIWKSKLVRREASLDALWEKELPPISPWPEGQLDRLVAEGERNGKVEALKKDIKAIKSKIDRLEKELSGVKDNSWKNYSLPSSEIEAKKVPKDLVSCLYLKADVQKLKEEHAKKQVDRPTGKVLPCEVGTKWEDISITLIADNMVRIRTPVAQGRFTYHQLKMQDKRAGDKPTMLWELLKMFARNNGSIHSENIKYDRKLPDTAKRLNKHLKGLFGIDESIYQAHYRTKKEYRTRIRFDDQTV